MKRFLKISVLLIVSLFLLVSGVNSTLDHLSRSTSQSTYTLYNERGEIVVAYTGDLSACRAYTKPVPIIAPNILHRS